MNKEEIKKQFEIAALGCLDNQQYRQFIKTVIEDEELKKEFGQYQKVTSLIPFSLNFQQPPIETKNKVVIGIKKIILSKIKETKTSVQPPEEKIIEVTATDSVVEKINETAQIETDKRFNDFAPQSQEIVSDTIEESVDGILEKEIISEEFTKEPIEPINSTSQPVENPEVKVNIDYSPILKEEIVEEVTKKIKKTISYQFEEFENKINKGNKLIKILLIIITLLTLILVASNVYQIFYSFEKKVEIKKEIKTPALESPDSLL